MRYKKKWYKKVLLFLFFAAALIWTLVPVYIVISNSFRRTLDMKIMPPEIIFTPILSHYEKILTLDNFSKYFRNSAVIAVSVTALTILLGTLAAYGMKLFKSRLGQHLSNVLLLGKMVPAITILIPLFMMMNRLKLTGTFAAPILAHSCMSLPFVTWLMASFIRDIPTELLESASEMCIRDRIMAYHNLGVSKADQIGMAGELWDQENTTAEQKEAWLMRFKRLGLTKIKIG